ncbi:MAG: Lrp/AsnC family transcriptional regulator [Nanoarchaeota archaeon]|nr:Lrp/AsnC family transcriptional regulator [Nanoarchaeota archaeon]
MLDEKSQKILDLLQKNAKLTSRQISKKLLVPITTVHNRIKKMEKEGYIKGYVALIDHRKLGKEILSFILVTVRYYTADGDHISQEDLARTISRLPPVEEIYIVTGGTDIIIKVRVKNIDELNQFVIHDLRNIEGVENSQTMIVLSANEAQQGKKKL